jgi:hypothetical protein
VRPISVTCLLALLITALVGMPVLAAPTSPASAPLGVIVQADNAQVGADLSAGATIYDGDRLATTDGTLRARLGGPQLVLHMNSSALVHGLPNGFSADLAAGTVVVSSSQGQTFQLLADGATIRPAGTQGTVGQITKVSATELLLSSSRGGLEVTYGGEVKTVEAGSSYRMEIDPEDADPGPQGGPLHTGRRRRAAYYAIAGGVAVVTGILIWRALMSPCGL